MDPNAAEWLGWVPRPWADCCGLFGMATVRQGPKGALMAGTAAQVWEMLCAADEVPPDTHLYDSARRTVTKIDDPR